MFINNKKILKILVIRNHNFLDYCPQVKEIHLHVMHTLLRSFAVVKCRDKIRIAQPKCILCHNLATQEVK